MAGKTYSISLATVGALVLGTMAPQPAQAQFRLPDLTRNAVNDAQGSDSGCEEGKSKSMAGRVLGGLLGRSARNVAGSTGITRWIPVEGFSDQLSEAIACRLDPEEQAQAAEATLQATRSDEASGELPSIGSTAAWSSNTREGVSGRSTVVARQALADDTDCITVTDVVIVKGEETKADKRMCRPPGQRRYSIVA